MVKYCLVGRLTTKCREWGNTFCTRTYRYCCPTPSLQMGTTCGKTSMVPIGSTHPLLSPPFRQRKIYRNNFFDNITTPPRIFVVKTELRKIPQNFAESPPQRLY